MPILQREIDIYPENLLESGDCQSSDEDGASWWALYTFARMEKELMRRLRTASVPFYGPILPKRYRSPGGRIRTSYVPLFSNYVFMFGDELQRYEAVSTGCVSRNLRVVDGAQLTQDLWQIRNAIQLGVPLTPESRVKAGDRVRVRSGKFRGYEGYIIRREGQTRLLVYVNFLQKGASMLLEDCEIEPTEWSRSA